MTLALAEEEDPDLSLQMWTQFLIRLRDSGPHRRGGPQIGSLLRGPARNTIWAFQPPPSRALHEGVLYSSHCQRLP
jgi:hypothetical protein